MIIKFRMIQWLQHQEWHAWHRYWDLHYAFWAMKRPLVYQWEPQLRRSHMWLVSMRVLTCQKLLRAFGDRPLLKTR